MESQGRTGPGQKGSDRAYKQLGGDMVYVRYRYNEEGFRIKTIELVFDKVKIG